MRPTVLSPELREIFGADDDPPVAVEHRARLALRPRRFIVWEGDPQTFAFSYVGGDAQALLGHPAREWIDSPTFWVDHVVHPEDKLDAIAFCALATGKALDHVFEYRAQRRGGGTVWLSDYVRVITGGRGVPVRLRGVMIDITQDKEASGLLDAAPTRWEPSRAELDAA